jgi:hypothetical protein
VEVVIGTGCVVESLTNELRVMGDGRVLEEIGDGERAVLESERGRVSVEELH